jgi:hypothetical protein
MYLEHSLMTALPSGMIVIGHKNFGGRFLNDEKSLT